MNPRRPDLAARVSNVRFEPVRFRPGYDMGEVDLLLDRLEAAVDKGEPVDRIVAEARFSITRFREGYAIAEVDAFLRHVDDEVGGRAPADVPTSPAAEPVRRPRAEDVASPPPSVIEEQHGLLARLFRRR